MFQHFIKLLQMNNGKKFPFQISRFYKTTSLEKLQQMLYKLFSGFNNSATFFEMELLVQHVDVRKVHRQKAGTSLETLILLNDEKYL